jgi:hypothetical protein
MTIESFQETLRRLLRQEPFTPFAVELLDGERFVVDRPDAVGFNGGSAVFLDGEGLIHSFTSESVRAVGGSNGTPPGGP